MQLIGSKIYLRSSPNLTLYLKTLQDSVVLLSVKAIGSYSASKFGIDIQDSSGLLVWDGSTEATAFGLDAANHVREGSTCLEPNNCYTATIYDSTALDDGSTGGDGGGWLRLFWDDEKFGRYNANKDEVFSSKSFTFGDSCKSSDEEVISNQDASVESGSDVANTDDANIASSCSDFKFEITLDSMPSEVGYSLVDNEGKKIWDEQNPWSPEDEYQTFTVTECLPVDDCYVFVITDSGRCRFNSCLYFVYLAPRPHQQSISHLIYGSPFF